MEANHKELEPGFYMSFRVSVFEASVGGSKKYEGKNANSLSTSKPHLGFNILVFFGLGESMNIKTRIEK
jgi:hypothetical protein